MSLGRTVNALRAVVVLAFLGSVGCACTPSDERPPRDPVPEVGRVCATDLVTAPSASLLHATLRIPQPRVARIEDLAVEVTLSNPSAAPVRWLGTYAEAGSLALEVRDEACAPVLPGPPPMPRFDDGVTNWRSLLPGGTVSLASKAGS